MSPNRRHKGRSVANLGGFSADRSKLQELVAPIRQSFGEEQIVDVCFLDDLARFKPHFAKRGSAGPPGAFVQETITVNQSLRGRLRIVWIFVHDFVAVKHRLWWGSFCGAI